MIRILERYIAKTIIAATGLAALVISALLFIMTLLGEFKNLGHGDFGFIAATVYALERMPNMLYQFSPMLILMGSIVGLSLLSSHRELAVMRTSGLSMRHVILSVLGAALAFILVISVVGELTGPELSHHAEIRKDNLQNAGQAVVTTAGVWLHVDNNFVHIDHVVGKHLLQGVTRYQFDDAHRLLASYYAKTMTRENDVWVMHDAVKTNFVGNRTISQSFSTLNWDLPFNSHLLNTAMVEPSEMTLIKLSGFAGYLEQNGLQSSQYRYEFWSRVFTPLASLVMIFLAIPFVLGSLGQLSMGLRLLAGVIAGFAFFIMNAFLGQLCIVYQLPAPFAALFPILVFASLGFFLAKRLLTT